MNPGSYHIVLLEPFFTGSHRSWAERLKANSRNQITILSLPGRHWKWRMHGAALSFAKAIHQIDQPIDLILATSLMDLSVFLGLCRKKLSSVPVALYMHETQLSYPWSDRDPDVKLKRDRHYAFINYSSALAADAVFFNSAYHKDAFLGRLPEFLSAFPDHQEKENVKEIEHKSSVLALGLDLRKFDEYKVTTPRQGNTTEKQDSTERIPNILWNHRWEHDKNPIEFFETLKTLKDQGFQFSLTVLGNHYREQPPIFAKAKKWFEQEIKHWAYAPDFSTYAQLLWEADLLPVNSNQDFFGGSVVEAIYCNTFPLLPNRLAYPEHLPATKWNDHLYQDNADLIQKMITFFKNFQLYRQQDSSLNVSRYDWKNVISTYDQAFANLIECPA